MCLNPSLLVNPKHVIRNHISVGVKHMLKSCSVLNGCFLELEPTLLFLFFFGTIHLCSSTHLYRESLGSTHPAGKRVALWLLREKPDRSITHLTSRTLPYHFTRGGQSFWMGTSCHVARSRKSKQLIRCGSTGFGNEPQRAERACPDRQTYRPSPHRSVFV